MSLHDFRKAISFPDRGDFVDSDEEPEVEECTEDRKDYHLGFYYPIRIGDVLNKTYRIEHKLGHGDLATVWLARDIPGEKDVALKIIKPGIEGENEYNMQNEIISTMQDTSNILTYQTTFFLSGNKGNHRVLVFPVRGPCLSFTFVRQISMPTRMSAARQLLKALERLHNAGIVHQHLNNGNVLFDIASLDNFDTKTKYEYLGRPKKVALTSHLWRPGELVKPMEVPKSLLRETVYLSDFSMAIKAGTEVNRKVLFPFVFCAPERFHGVNPSFASDMWSFMCIFSYLYLGCVPWHSTNSNVLMAKMVEALGPLPEQWKSRYSVYSSPGNKSWYDQSNDSWYDQGRRPNGEKDLETMIKKKRPEASPIEQKHILSIMSKGFSYLPEGRLTATELLRDASFKAVMEIYCR